MMDLKPLSHSVHPRAGSQSVCKALKAASVSPVAQGSGDGSNQQSSTAPYGSTLCLPDITLVTRSPRSSPPHLHAASDQRLEEMKTWE